ncbi:diguanylate cyclase [Caballeronia hypogeia]|uniref:Putative 4-hydroxy-4-methyl-2-oxoglutarate aldolase n=1 Tax=Caballeronia hypogeia TaxID=1777140 RepID=A0A158CIY2_9BURK|nr:hypothetical protein [Caballeronia hypogeia]SAK82323.1 diguanylate cyclase [Caballeronia hypogeia]
MFRLKKMPEKIGSELVEMALGVEPATIGHFRLTGFPRPAVRPAITVPRIVGPAVTLALPGADSSLLHHAVNLLREGDVLVIDRLGDGHHACLGGGVAFALKNKGIAGVVIDGPVADPHELREIGLPVWATGVSSITTRLLGVGGEMNFAISCGGAVVHPGDLVIADEAGVVFLPVDEAHADIDRAASMQRAEREALKILATNSNFGELSGATSLVKAKLNSQ